MINYTVVPSDGTVVSRWSGESLPFNQISKPIIGPCLIRIVADEDVRIDLQLSSAALNAAGSSFTIKAGEEAEISVAVGNWFLASVAYAPEVPVAARLLANPAPSEPVAQEVTGSKVNSDFMLAPTSNYDLDIHGIGDTPWRVFIASNSDATVSLYLENRGNGGHLGFFYTRSDSGPTGTTQTYQVTRLAELYADGKTTSIRIRRKNKNFTVYIGDDHIRNNVKSLTFNDMYNLVSDDTRYVRIVNTYNNIPVYTVARLAPTSLVTDRLVLDNTAIDSESGILTTDIGYYLDAAGYLTGRIESLGGELLAGPARYEVVANNSAGNATLRFPVAIPSSKRGSVVKIVTTSEDETTLRDEAEVTFPGETHFGQNVANIFSVFRGQRTTTNMMQQGYWQDTFGTMRYNSQGQPVNLFEQVVAEYAQGNVYEAHARDYYTWSRNTPNRHAPPALDEKGWPLRANLWYWYPLPDEQNVEKTYVLKWTGGPISIRHFEGACIKNLGPIVKVDDNTYKWTLMSDAIGLDGIPHGRIQFDAIDTANPPKNMTLCLQGEDLSQRFLPSFIDFLKLLPGRLRFMDDRGVNGERYRLGLPWVWADRAIQDNGSACSLAVEDMIELCNRSGRPLLYNIHPSFAYEEGGIEYYNRELDMLFNGTGAMFSTPGIAAPNGIVKTIAPEIGNENWNPGFGGQGSYHYLADVGVREGLVVADNGNGSLRHGNLIRMRNLVQVKLMAHLQARITDWRSRTTRVLGVQMGASDLVNLMGDAEWEDATLYVDEIACAPYIPGDPNAGSVSSSIPDKSPAGICAFLADYLRDHIAPDLEGNVQRTLKAGFAHCIYEVNVATIALGLTLQQNKDLQSSQEYYDFWKNNVIPLLVSFGGDIALYSDTGPIHTGEQWSMHHIPGSEYNKSWDAVVDWSHAN